MKSEFYAKHKRKLKNSFPRRSNLVSRVLRLVGQRMVDGRETGVMGKFDVFDWFFKVTKLRNVNCGIHAVTIPVPQSLSWRPYADQEA